MCIRDSLEEEVRAIAHGLHAAGDGNVDVAGCDALRGEHHGFEPRTADLVDRCLLYTSDAADERSSVDLGGRRIIKKKTILKPRLCIVVHIVQPET